MEETVDREERHIVRKSLVAQLPFVFIVGLDKKATTSLHHCFRDHDRSGVHYGGGRLAETLLRNVIRGRRIFEGLRKPFSGVRELVVNTPELRFEADALFPALDRVYPGSSQRPRFGESRGVRESLVSGEIASDRAREAKRESVSAARCCRSPAGAGTLRRNQ
jgi:hypothetical protein